MRRRVVVATCAISLAIGCADVFGLGDYTEQDAGTDATTEDAALDSPADASPDSTALEGGGDADASDATGNDAEDAGDAAEAADADDGAVTTTCTGVCVPPLPSGWTFVAYDRAFRPNCASGYGTPTDVEEGLSAGAASCTCSCTTTSPSCSSIVVTVGDGGQNGCDNQTSQNDTTDGGCTSLAAAITTLGGEKMSATVTPNGGGCTPDAGVTVPAVTYAYQGRICEPLTAPGGGCDAGVCFPAPSPYGVCVYQSGAVACPSSFPVQYSVGSSVTDTRGCAACTCGYDGGSCGGSVTFYTGGGTCNLSSQTIAADGTCQTVTNQTFKTFQYAPSVVAASCTPSTAAPTGSAAFASVATVCCTP